MTLGLTLAAPQPPSAHAFGNNVDLECAQGGATSVGGNTAGIGHSDLLDVDRYRVERGKVDFGDGLHLGGRPGSDAIVCWSADRTAVKILGRLYWDDATAGPRGCAFIEIRVYTRAGTPVDVHEQNVCGNGGGLRQELVAHVVRGQDLNRVRIALSGQIESGASRIGVYHGNRYHGD